MFRFDGRVVLLTGASRGIGLITGKLLIKQGAKVMAVARNEAALKENFGEHYKVCDVSSFEECQQLVDYTIEKFGKIDVLVCNHGIGSANEKPIQDTAIDDWKRNMDINLNGPFYLTRLILPYMIKQKYGRCVYTSSTAATTGPEYGAPAYNTSKTGLLGIVGSVSQDGGLHGSKTANAVLPGWVKTEMADKSAKAEALSKNVTTEQIWNERAELYPPKRVVTPTEVANSIVFLSSEESSGISGEAIRVSLGCPW